MLAAGSSLVDAANTAGPLMTGVAAVATAVWAIFKERSRRRGVAAAAISDEAPDGYVKTSLKAFEELVDTLQSEIARLIASRESIEQRLIDYQGRAERRERDLLERCRTLESDNKRLLNAIEELEREDSEPLGRHGQDQSRLW